MGSSRSSVLVLVLVRLCWFSLRAVGEATTAAPGTTAHSSTAANSSRAGPKGSGPGDALSGLKVDRSMIQRALYVLIGITVTGLFYFLIRAVR